MLASDVKKREALLEYRESRFHMSQFSIIQCRANAQWFRSQYANGFDCSLDSLCVEEFSFWTVKLGQVLRYYGLEASVSFYPMERRIEIIFH